MLALANERLLALKNQGVSVEDAILQAPLKDLEPDWGGGIFSADKWIGIVFSAQAPTAHIPRYFSGHAC